MGDDHTHGDCAHAQAALDDGKYGYRILRVEDQRAIIEQRLGMVEQEMFQREMALAEIDALGQEGPEVDALREPHLAELGALALRAHRLNALLDDLLDDLTKEA